MKNKKSTFILSLLVMAVWGAIFLKIFHSVNDKDSAVFARSTDAGQLPYNDYTVVNTAQLLLNYRDPFGISSVLDVPVSLVSTRSKKYLSTLKRLEKPSVQDYIKYSGYIRNAGSRQIIAMLNINGKDVMMAEGETAEKVKLLKNLRDSVKIVYQGKIQFIAINSSYP